MSKKSFVFPVRFARRIPDPIFSTQHNAERHIFIVAAKDVPQGLSLDPNARTPNIRRRVYEEVKESLLNLDCVPGTFHLKNKGITLIANSVTKKTEDSYVVEFKEGHGIVDGGHTYKLITTLLGDPSLPNDQFVKIEILTGIPDEWVPEIAGGLNTSVQVQEHSLLDLEGAFNWIKDELKDEPYYGEIAWSENENGSFEVRDIISMMTCFNVDFYPNNGDSHPISAYEKKSAALKTFEADYRAKNGKSYKKLRPLLKDILILYDTIRYEFREVWNKQGGKGGSLAIVEAPNSERSKPFQFPFIRKESKYRLTRGALYPILASFRWMIEEDKKTGQFRWRGGFNEVLRRWQETSKNLVRLTVEKGQEVGRNPDAIGKSRAHWGGLHKEVAFVDLMKKATA